jgi:release factor glutamine methyltransferase
MNTFEDLILYYSKILKRENFSRPRKIVEEIVANILNISRSDLFLSFEKNFCKTELIEIEKKLDRILEKDLLEYVIGYVEFYNCHITVNPKVLIPRQETELLMDIFVKSVKDNNISKNIFDVCCGSACLAIAAKRKFPLANVFASDISSDALQVAKYNAKHNKVDVKFFKGSLFKPYKGLKADYILCNPPYLSKKEFDEINNAKEPAIALIGGELGLEFYEKIAKELLNYVNPKAKVFFEIGHLQGKAIREIFSKIPFQKSKIIKDFAGHDRFFFLEIE